jgi:uncharacterized protein (DUF2336 family)
MIAERSLIDDLENAIKSGSQDKRIDTLRRITDLFVVDAARLNDREVDVFNDVLEHLIARIEGKALAELSRRLAPIANAPAGVVRRLASDDNITIAEPVLTQSARLSDKDLIEIANTKTQAHLLAISGRSRIDTSVTDALLQRGNQNVLHRLAENQGAGFSETGFATLVKHSQSDEQLAEKVGLRRDVPMPLFRELVQRATEAVRSRLLSSASPETRQRLQSALAAVSTEEEDQAGFRHYHDFADAHARVLALHKTGELRESSIFHYAKMQQYADMIAGVSVLCGAPMELVENLLQSKHRETFLIPCKAAGLQWETVLMLMTHRFNGATLSGDDHNTVRADYAKLSPAAAERVLRFWHVRQAASKDTAAPAAS